MLLGWVRPTDNGVSPFKDSISYARWEFSLLSATGILSFRIAIRSHLSYKTSFFKPREGLDLGVKIS